ncbi:MAG TPA: hypothetical protein DD376_02860 [Sutterella sp.]|nr:hypothetical protein [Sutterella sp.]
MSSAKESYPEFSILRAFLLTAETGSFTKAASIMKVTQPAISNAIAKLEEFAGVPLFNRTARPIQLTAAGHRARRRIKPLLEDLSSLALDIKNSTSDVRLDLRIGFSDSYGACIAPLLTPDLVTQVDNFAAYCQNSPTTVRRLIAKQLDIAVATKFPSENPAIRAKMFMSENFLFVTPRKFEGQIHQVPDLAVLPKSLPVIRFNDDSLDSIQIERILRQCDFHGNRRLEVDTNQSAMNLVASGAGWTILPPLGVWAAREFLPAVSLHFISSLHSTRQFYVMSQFSAYESLVNFIYLKTKNILQEKIFPEMRSASPLLISSIFLTDF